MELFDIKLFAFHQKSISFSRKTGKDLFSWFPNLHESSRFVKIGLCFLLSLAQLNDLSAQLENSDSDIFFPTLPNTRPLHPVGVFTLQPFMSPPLMSSRKKNSLNIETSAGNVWLPALSIYIPKNINATLDQNLRTLPFYHRLSIFQEATFPRDTIQYAADGIIRNFRIDFRRRIHKQQTIGITLTSHLLTGGGSGINYFLSDAFIERIHTDVIKKDDPFGRKQFPYNEALIEYTDEEGQTFTWKKDQFLFSSVELYYDYHWAFSENNFGHHFLNISGHLLLPTTRMNPYLSAGIGFHWGYQVPLRNKKQALVFMMTANFVKQTIWQVRDGVNPLNRSFNYGIDSYIGYTKKNKDTKFSVGVQLLTESSFHDGSDMKRGFETTAFQSRAGFKKPVSWAHLAAISLFSTRQNWNLITTLENHRGSIGFYLQEDFWVNNAPDFQMGAMATVFF